MTGEVEEHTFVSADGPMAASDLELKALTLNVARCSLVTRSGSLAVSNQWAGRQSFRAGSVDVNDIIDGQMITVICRRDERIVEHVARSTAP